ncbi:MAG: hypothetical protein WC359_13820 [Dehalococcoidia bacterium]|jgi:hypothetical protein
MDKNVLLVGALAAGLLLLTKKGINPVTAFQPATTPIIQTPALQAVQEALANFRIVDTGQDLGGADILQDLTLPGNPLILQSGIVTIGPNTTKDIMGCVKFDRNTLTGEIFDFSTHQCHTLPWYREHQPGLVQTWGL